MTKEEPQNLEDYDPGFVVRNAFPTRLPGIEEKLSEKLNVSEVNLENMGVALNGLYDAYKTKTMGNFVELCNKILPIALEETDFKVSGGILTEEEVKLIADKTTQLGEQYPEVSERYTVTPITSGSIEEDGDRTVKLLANVDTYPDKDEAFSLLATFKYAADGTTALDIRFDKPVDPNEILLAEKTEYVLDEMEKDRDEVIKLLESGAATAIIKSINSAIENANEKFGGATELTPELMLTEMKIQAGQEAAINAVSPESTETRLAAAPLPGT